ncbi:MAG: hypothetical protein P8Y29_01105, partial [Gemmatimonadota bacterium]
MMTSIAEIIDRTRADKVPVWQVVLTEEVEDTEQPEDAILKRLAERLATMRSAVERGLSSDAPSVSGLLGGGAHRFDN